MDARPLFSFFFNFIVVSIQIAVAAVVATKVDDNDDDDDSKTTGCEYYIKAVFSIGLLPMMLLLSIVRLLLWA